jgi:phospholipase B1
MIFIKPIITLAVACVSSAAAASVASISGCPALTPRTTEPKDVTDLRIDDIGIVAGLGDR